MDLFEMRNGYAFPSIHALLIEPYKSMWVNDTSLDKIDCINDFTYIELLCSPKRSNPYFNIPEPIRPDKVKLNVYKDKDHPVTEQVLLGILQYKEFLSESSSYELLMTGENTVNSVKEFLDSFDPDSRSRSGGLILKPSDVLKAVEEIPAVIKSLALARDRVHSELEEDTKNRRNRETGPYEE